MKLLIMSIHDFMNKDSDMTLPHNLYKQVINSYTLKDWEPLLDTIPRIENQESFGKLSGDIEVEDNNIILPLFIEASIVGEFREIVYQIPIIIDFDWAHWDEGHNMACDEDFEYDTIDIPTKCKLITAFVRNDRFCDGALAGAFERGTILKILKSIQKQIDDE